VKTTPFNASFVAVLRRAQVQKLLQMSRSAIYERLNHKSPRHDPLFPRPIRYAGSRCVYWLESEVKAWLDLQVYVSRASGPGLCHSAASNASA
jgi:prophage regulatory protein